MFADRCAISIETALLEDLPFKQLYQRSLDLVEHETMVIPYTTPHGHRYILRVLNPDEIFLGDSLIGDDGDIVLTLMTWYRNWLTIIRNIPGATSISEEAYNQLVLGTWSLERLGFVELGDLSRRWSMVMLTIKQRNID